MENVPRIQHETVFTDFVNTLNALKYKVYHDVLYCPDYGVPQKRRRLVLIASKFGEIAPFSKTHTSTGQNGLEPYRTVKEAIGDLPEITDGQAFEGDPLHRTQKLSTLNKKRLEQSKPGGTWLDWDPELRAPCHRRPSGQTYKSVYARMKWTEPAPTITTQFYNFGTGRFGHPDQDRALSLREGALLQTFPPDYNFIDPSAPAPLTRLGIHIGMQSLSGSQRLSVKASKSTWRRSVMNKPEYEMSIDLNVLNHLGLNLYSNVPAVLSEVVANSWDADATEVDIEIGSDKITITDNGHGMTYDDINGKYLKVGYERRRIGGGRTANNRRVMGRKA